MWPHRLLRSMGRLGRLSVIVLSAIITVIAFGPIGVQAQQAPVSVNCPTVATERVGRHFGGAPPVTFAVSPDCFCMQGTPPTVAELTERARFEAALAALTEQGLSGVPNIQSFKSDQTVVLTAWLSSGSRAALTSPLTVDVSLPATLAIGQIESVTYQCYRSSQMETMHQTFIGYAAAVDALYSFLVNNP